MKSATDVVWWQRLLFALGALVFTLLLSIALCAIHDFSREPGLQWGNGGEIQVSGFILIVGGIVVLATYVLLVVPLVLLWPVASQRKHWYGMLCVAAIWPVLQLWIALLHEHPSIKNIQQYLPLYGRLQLFALCSCGSYLLLIHWQHRRLLRSRN